MIVFNKRKEENQNLKDQIFFLEQKIITLKLENESLKDNNKNYANNLLILQNTIEEIKNICNNTKGSVVGKTKILEQLGE